MERELVKAEFANITTMDPTEVAKWEQLRMMLSFPNTRRTAEAMQRTRMRSRKARDAVMHCAGPSTTRR